MDLKVTRRQASATLFAAAAASAPASAQGSSAVTKYVRFRKGANIAFGILDGDTVKELKGNLLANPTDSGVKHKLSDVKLLTPIVSPSKILALAGNYRSHLGKADPRTNPEPFYKPPSSLQNPEDPIVTPKDASPLHHECELVIVIGKRCSKVTEAQAKDYIFGYTAGNDVSERIWQNDVKTKDVQWWRAKGADTFSPVGPVIAKGLDTSNLKIACRVNGQVKQEDSTSQLVHGPHKIVSYISQYVTMLPGDLIFTGTPGKTTGMKPGDVVEVEIEGIGILRNRVIAG
jgi:2-keto-4-pentenoate hydratase/2-oxohepta-3-ene-1,7-dioic acid hydratase in catechol pathway